MIQRGRFLAVGHVCLDLRDEGYVVGGSAAYSSVLARNLGYRAAVLTSAADDFPFEGALGGVEIFRRQSPENTVFVNRRRGKRRIQFVESVAESLDLSILPPEWRKPDVLYLCPILNEFSAAEALEAIRARTVGIAPQGWLRKPSPKGLVCKASWGELERVAGRAHFVIASHEEVSPEEVEAYRELFPIFVLTRGAEGADLYVHGIFWGRIPAIPADEVDETGAGDVFGSAFAVRYHETGDPVEAAYFAAAAASLAVEGVGLAGVPESRGDVLLRLGRLVESLRYRVLEPGVTEAGSVDETRKLE